MRRQLRPAGHLEKAVDFGHGGKWIAWEANEELQLPRASDQSDATRGAWLRLTFLERAIGDGLDLAQARGVITVGIAGDLHFGDWRSRLAPEIQLLFKAKYNRPKDRLDFERAITRFGAMQRKWLAEALTQYHAGHPWDRGPRGALKLDACFDGAAINFVDKF